MASDVTIALQRPGRPIAQAGDVLAAGRSTRVAQPKRKRGPQRRAADVALAAAAQQLTAELAAARQALELERERRTGLEHALDDEREVVTQMRARLAALELQLSAAVAAATVQPVAVTADLPAGQPADVIGERAVSGGAELPPDETIELELERLTNQDAAAPAPEASERAEPRVPDRPRLTGDWLDDGDPMPEADDARAAPRSQARRARRPKRPAARGPRPVNPSLRHRTWWFGRLVALLILLTVLAAIWIAIRSTLLHHGLSLP